MANKHIPHNHNPATSATIEWLNPFIAVGLFFINPIIAASNALFYLLIKYDIQQTESKSFPLSAFIAQYITAGLALTAWKFLPQTYALFITPFVLFSYLISNILFVEKPVACNTTKLSQSASTENLSKGLFLGIRPQTPHLSHLPKTPRYTKMPPETFEEYSIANDGEDSALLKQALNEIDPDLTLTSEQHKQMLCSIQMAQQHSRNFEATEVIKKILKRQSPMEEMEEDSSINISNLFG